MLLDATYSSMVYDTFVYEGQKIAVLNNVDSYDKEFKNLLLLAAIVHTEIGKVLVGLSAEKYDEIAEYYLMLKSAYSKGDK